MTEGIVFNFWFFAFAATSPTFWYKNYVPSFNPIALPNTAEFSMLYECRANSVEALRITMVQLWRFIMYNCSTGEGSTKDETNLETLPAEGTQKAVPQQSVIIDTKLF